MTVKSNRVIVVTGRAPDLMEFVSNVKSHLFDNFDLAVAQAIPDTEGIDGMERFIGFITGEEFGSATFEAVQVRLHTAQFGATIYDEMEVAVAEAKEQHGFEDDSDEVERMGKIREKYTPFTAEETEQMAVFQAMFTNGHWTVVRGLWGEEEVPCTVIAMIFRGADEVRITPLAVLFTKELADNLKLPHQERGSEEDGD